MSRRNVLCFAAALAASRGTPALAALLVADFMKLSATLTQNPLADLDPDFGGHILDAIVAQGWEVRLVALQASPQSDPDLARLIVAAWYSGLISGKSGDVLVGYENALVFQNVDFMHVLGDCGGAFGDWAKKP
jgi:hypothetical protein